MTKKELGWFTIMVRKERSWETWVYDSKAKKRETQFSCEGAKTFAIQSARDVAEDIAKREIRGYDEAEIVCLWQRPTTEEEDEAGFIPEDEEVASFHIISHEGEEDEWGEPLAWEVIEG